MAPIRALYPIPLSALTDRTVREWHEPLLRSDDFQPAFNPESGRSQSFITHRAKL